MIETIGLVAHGLGSMHPVGQQCCLLVACRTQEGDAMAEIDCHWEGWMVGTSWKEATLAGRVPAPPFAVAREMFEVFGWSD